MKYLKLLFATSLVLLIACKKQMIEYGNADGSKDTTEYSENSKLSPNKK